MNHVVDHVEFLAKISKRFPQVEYQTNALRMRSPSTHSHSMGVVQSVFYVGKALGYDDEQMLILGIGGLLHDLGKTNLEGKILEGQRQLTEIEWGEMVQHPLLGFSYILQPYDASVPEPVRLPFSIRKLESGLAMNVADAVLGHHEHGRDRYPTDPYAEWFKATERRHIIPELFQMSQIICACDILDALVTFRTYKEIINYEDAIAQLKREFRGDRRIVEIIDSSIGIAHLYCQSK